MTYVQGFVVAVPATSKDAYREHAASIAPLLREFGATRLVEAWGDDVPDGKDTDFKRAVKAKPDEVVVFSWLEYPSKEACDAASEKIKADPRMGEMGVLPFDRQRMIHGGFALVCDQKGSGKVGYIDATVIPVPAANKDAFVASAAKMAAAFRDAGATRVVDGWADDIPDDKVTDFKGAVKAGNDEKVVFGWVEWPSKQVRDEAWKTVMADPRLQGEKPPFDGKRMIYGGFAPILDA